MEYIFVSRSHQDTVRLGTALGKALTPGCVVALIGDLGAGKTCFIKGIACGINNTPETEVTSPTFTILHEYEGSPSVYHFDAYRLSGSADLETIGFEDYIDGNGVCIVEWADRIQEALPEECLTVHIDLMSEQERRFTCESSGQQHDGVLRKFCDGIDPDAGC